MPRCRSARRRPPIRISTSRSSWPRPRARAARPSIRGMAFCPNARPSPRRASMRLVPDQKPDDIWKKYTDFVKKNTPKGVTINVKQWSVADPCVVSTDNKFVQASAEAMHEVLHKDTVYIRSGGSIPSVADFEKELKIPSRSE